MMFFQFLLIVGCICWALGAKGCHFSPTFQALSCNNDIPLNIPANTTYLYLDFTNTSVPSVTFSNDSGRLQGADDVRNLLIDSGDNNQILVHVKAGGLALFNNLRYLRVDLANIILDEDAFDGLITLRRLAFYGSVNLSCSELLFNLNPKTLPDLRELSLYKVGTSREDAFDIDTLNRRFRHVILKVFISDMNVTRINVGYLWFVTRVNFEIADSSINSIRALVEDSQTQIPIGIRKTTIVRLVVLGCARYGYRYSVQVPFTSATILKIENVCNDSIRVYKIANLTLRNGFQLNTGKVFNVTELSITNCLLKNASNPLFTRHVSLTTLLLSSNDMSFIHPDTFTMTTSLTHLDLSYNNLQNMNKIHSDLFERLFAQLDKLQIVNLRENNLTYIPANMFINNILLSRIDLSHNSFSHLPFLKEGLNQLTYINLQRNALFQIDSSVVDRLSLLCLNRKQGNKSSQSGVVLKGNPLGCSSCRHNELISWIKKTSDCISNVSAITCYDENGRLTNILTKSSLDCPNAIIHVVIYVALSLIFLVAAVVTCIVKRKRPGFKANFGRPVIGLPMNDENRPPCKYFVFLAYSSLDEEFVNNKVKTDLIEGLKARIKDDTEPVCIGDLKFRLGRHIHGEIITCIEQSKAVLILLTDHYCRSDYCVTEFQRAIQLHKPVIVMVKDKVDERLMTPEIKLHYKTNARIIWNWENGDYVLKTSWKNICDSLVNLDRRA